MSRIYKFALLSVLIVVSLACSLITTPISDAKNLASTAQAIASSMPVETLQALPTSVMDLGGYANPTGQPVSDWNGIPIMPAASVGQEFNQNTYSFKVNDTLENAQTFYNNNLKALGWTPAFSAQGGTQGSVMLFTKDSSVLSITVTETDGELLVLLISQ